MYWIREKALPDEIYQEAKRIGKTSRYNRILKENGESLFLARVPLFINTTLHIATENTVGKRFKEIISFYRLNSAIHDYEFRIHCDTVIQGQQPTHACVFYLHSSNESGTALYEHRFHGREDAANLAIFDSDDGLWKAWHKVYAKENKLFVYKSSLFHGRFPWRCWGDSRENGRIVIVKILKEVL